MTYVLVLVGDATFHGGEALTYSSDRPLAAGTLVLVPLRKKEVLGLVTALTTKPAFAVKPISSVPALPPLPVQSLQLLAWLHGYYPAPLGVITQLFLPKQLPKKPEPPTVASPVAAIGLPPLSSDQSKAVAAITAPGLHILHGDTGTGKTRVYIELAMRSIKLGKSAIILTPEIGLTSQLANDFRDVFGEQVVVVHSQLTEATRQRIWQKLLEQTGPVIVIGARSALFSPVHKLGLIVIDESHETAYKQDQSPYYHTTPVAAQLAALHKATLVLGSATPLVSDYYIAQAKHRPIIRMQQAAKQHQFSDSTVAVVDLRERSQFGKSPYLSNALLHGIDQALQRNEQALIFLNRRGTARIVFCDSCGWQASCPHCDLPLVYHGDTHSMRCHSCNFKADSPTSCPLCRNASVVFKSIGTKAVAAEIQRLFPSAKIMRFDADNKQEERIEQHYDAVRNGHIDILVGTQTLAKGLDLPGLGFVGVVIADTSLFFPDFSAEERTYELLSQVLGRIGRGHRAGQAVIQTYNPDSPLLQAILTKDWDGFYQKEITERRTFRFPPFCYVIKLTCRRATSPVAQHTATILASKLHADHPGIIIEGPAPSFHEKVQNKYAWQLLVKSNRRDRLVQIIQSLPSGWNYDIDPMNLL